MSKAIYAYIIFATASSLLLFGGQSQTFIPRERQIKIGSNIYKVGKDSVLVVKGKFVREIQGRVYLKIN